MKFIRLLILRQGLFFLSGKLPAAGRRKQDRDRFGDVSGPSGVHY